MDIVIIEDEDLAAESLEKLLTTKHNLNVKMRLESVSQSIAWFRENTCDLIFSDIHLGDGESFEIFEELKIDIPIIFTTAFDQYAIQAFQFFAIDYLLKPYDNERLDNAIKKYLSHSTTTGNDFMALQSLITKLKTAEEAPAKQARFLVSKGEELMSINSEDVAYFMAENKLLFLYTKRGEMFLYEDTISNLEQRLSKTDFFKINRKFIVKHNAIKSILKYNQNRLKIILQPESNTNEPILISSKNIKAFKEWLDN